MLCHYTKQKYFQLKTNLCLSNLVVNTFVYKFIDLKIFLFLKKCLVFPVSVVEKRWFFYLKNVVVYLFLNSIYLSYEINIVIQSCLVERLKILSIIVGRLVALSVLFM